MGEAVVVDLGGIKFTFSIFSSGHYDNLVQEEVEVAEEELPLNNHRRPQR